MSTFITICTVFNVVVITIACIDFVSGRRLRKKLGQELRHAVDMTFFGYSGAPHCKLRLDAGITIEDALEKIVAADDCKTKTPRSVG